MTTKHDTETGRGRTRHPLAEREQVVRLHEGGLGSKRIARQLGLDDSTVRLWLRRYREYGAESLTPYWRRPGKKGSTQPPTTTYQEAVRMYRDGTLSQTEICRQLGLPYYKFNAYLNANHRDLIEQRYRQRVAAHYSRERGQRDAAREKYADAIRACDSTLYLDYNVTQIARLFDLSGTALANRLRVHFPEILAMREELRQLMGMGRNGMRPTATTKEARLYAKAISYLRLHTDARVAEVAGMFGHRPEALREYIRAHEPDLIEDLSRSRQKDGRVAPARTEAKYADALRQYESSTEPLKDIARRLGLQYGSLGSFIRRNYPDAIVRHNLRVRGGKR